ncbi:TonB-dependent receptor [Rhodoferax sp. AJA081-3]|uniref:TonB-dependent receptor n=1 Tax=Rhodoferax sp. AJA081-3 TaxID=2752316 RepID=UPI001AE05794|nr:TonB-dependent receptor [Rhodoferax sp. AJA081-3]QTN30103.1 TonB-dependent receptor [Rhodoferax sp. AJA081-3]
MTSLSIRAATVRAFPRHPLSLAIVAALTSLGATSAAAQSAPRTEAALPAVTITGNPLGATDLIAPTESYSGATLLLRSKSTLGETLDGTPGVSSSYFGPNASRPIIRGLDGDRVRILQNSGASVDASGLSNDHAVPSDPISMERIEVLRGPGALMYGGSAVGGVVNVIDNRIPQERQFDAKGGISGKLNLEGSSGDAARSAAALLETGTDRFTLHADAFTRRSGDVSVPIALACEKPGTPTVANAICNSSAQTQGGALGGSVFLGHSRLGASVSSYSSDYGTVAEDEVTIGMRSNRVALEWDVDQMPGWIQSVKVRASQTDYQHTEYEGAEPGTVFKNTGNDLRITARHAKLGAWQGVLGLQSETGKFSADGTEAFAPHSHTTQHAVFAFEELPLDWGRFSLGARLESIHVESTGNPQVERFVPASRSFQPRSLALGALWNAAPGWQLTSNIAYTERAPKDYELFADGPHIATHAYEVGDSHAVLEQSTNMDVGAQWKQGAHSFKLSAFVNQFNNYLSQQATGVLRDTEGNGAGGIGVTDDGTGMSVESGGTAEILPEYVYSQVPARFTGIEANGKLRLLDAGQTLDLELRADWVRATNTTTGEWLPRIAPVRLGAALVWAQGPWSARLDANHSQAQTNGPAGQLASQSYTLVNAAFSYRQQMGTNTALWFARLDNANDVLAYSATSILTQSAPGKAPLPGRSVKVGLQLAF